MYRKVPKFSDAKILCCNLSKIQRKRPNHGVFCLNNANGIAKSEDPDQISPRRQSDLGLHCLPRPICPKTLGHYGLNFRQQLSTRRNRSCPLSARPIIEGSHQRNLSNLPTESVPVMQLQPHPLGLQVLYISIPAIFTEGLQDEGVQRRMVLVVNFFVLLK